MYVLNDAGTFQPYGFVPYPTEEEVEEARGPVPDHAGGVLAAAEGASTLQTATLRCGLEALTPLLVADPHASGGDPSAKKHADRPGGLEQTALRHIQDGAGRLVIPGTSLKGMVRAVHEALTPSCVSTHSGQTDHLVPSHLTPCTDRHRACPSCRVFGFMEKGTSQGGVHKGAVRFGHARLAPEVLELIAERRAYDPDARGDERLALEELWQLPPLFSPHPEDAYLYGSHGAPKGRKFYFHQAFVRRPRTDNEVEYSTFVRALRPPGFIDAEDRDLPGATFLFDVVISGLQEDDLQSFVAALVLAHGVQYEPRMEDHLAAEYGLPEGGAKLWHKLGYGKAAGLGSVCVWVEEARLDGEDRYTSFDAAPRLLAGEAVDEWMDSCAAPFFSPPSERILHLVDLLQWPPHNRDCSPDDEVYEFDYPPPQRY